MPILARYMLPLSLLLILGLSGVLWATPVCDVLVADTADAVLGAAIPLVTEHAQALARMGVDVRVRTVGPTSNLDQDEWAMRTQCASWQAPNGNRKSTLLVLMVSPPSRKLGLYYGEAWQRALENHWNRIKNEIMAPRFRDGDYAGGFVAGLDQLARRLTTAQDEAIHPVTQTTVEEHTTINEAPDYSAFSFVPWLLGGGFLIAMMVVLYRTTRLDKEKSEAMQHRAVAAHNDVVALLARMDRRTYPMHQQQAYDAMAAAYADFHMSGHGDPNINGLHTAAYLTMRDRYEAMATELKQVPYLRRGDVPQAGLWSGQIRGRGSRRSAPASSNTVVQNTIIATGGGTPQTTSHDSSSSSWTSGGGGSSSYDSGSSGGGGSSDF